MAFFDTPLRDQSYSQWRHENHRYKPQRGSYTANKRKLAQQPALLAAMKDMRGLPPLNQPGMGFGGAGLAGVNPQQLAMQQFTQHLFRPRILEP